MIMYIVCIMSFVWRTGTTDDANRGPMTPEDAFALWIIVTAVLSLGLIYLALIASTLRRYGMPMDNAWRRKDRWLDGRESCLQWTDSHHPGSFSGSSLGYKIPMPG